MGLRLGHLLLGLLDQRSGVGRHLATLGLLDEVLGLLDDDRAVEGPRTGRREEDEEDERAANADAWHARGSSTGPRPRDRRDDGPARHGLAARTSRNMGRRRSSAIFGWRCSPGLSGTGSTLRSTASPASTSPLISVASVRWTLRTPATNHVSSRAPSSA